MNESLTCNDCIEYFIKDGKYYALSGGVVSEVTPGSQLYLTALIAVVSHKDYDNLVKKYGKGNDLVYGFIRDYLSGFNHTADIVDGKLIDCDGERVTIINQATVTPREKDIIRCISDGLCDKQVADLLGISVLTVNTILKNLRTKIHATSKYHIVSLSAKAGLV
jgi:DNA-binding CsgD family transcriptional regulator